jgi:hypothetical protein
VGPRVKEGLGFFENCAALSFGFFSFSNKYFQKLYFFPFYFRFFIFWVKMKLLCKNFFLEISNDIFQKIQDFIIGQPLNEMFPFFDML